jgi:hypothetical protein
LWDGAEAVNFADGRAGIFCTKLPMYHGNEKLSYYKFIVSEGEIATLYRRFQILDKQAAGVVGPEDLFSIPELAMNPISRKLIEFAFKMNENLPKSRSIESFTDYDGLDFRAFVELLSLFHQQTPLQSKMRSNPRILPAEIISFLGLFKIIVGRTEGANLGSILIRRLISELSGPLPDYQTDFLIQLTLAFFSKGFNETVSEDEFIHVPFGEGGRSHQF